MFNPIKLLGSAVKFVTGPISNLLAAFLPKGMATGTGTFGVLIGAAVQLLVTKKIIDVGHAQALVDAISQTITYISGVITVWGAARAHATDATTQQGGN